MALFSVLVLSLQPIVVNAGTYYFSRSGSDANSGADPAAPKQSLGAAAALAVAGNTLLFKRGDAWYNRTSAFDLRNKVGTADAPILIDAYGEGAKPVIANLELLDDAGWTNVPGTTTWKHDVSGYSDVWRLYIDGASKYKVNTTNEADIDQPHEWCIKPVVAGQNGVVFVNTGSLTVGPRYVEVHPVGSVSTVLMEDTAHLSVRNIDFRGGSQFNVIHVEAPCSHVVIDNNYIRQANGSGLLVANHASGPSEYISNITITNNVVDKVWSAQENATTGALTGDGIFILHAVDTGLVKGNTVRNWGHVGITLSSYRFGLHGVHNIVVEENEVTSGASGYMHAIDVSGFENHTTNNIIRRNYIHDYNATSHIQGNNNKFYSNVVVGVTLTTQANQSQQPWAIDLIPWRFTDGNWMAAHDNYIVNNTFVDVRQYPIVMSDNPSSTSVVGNNVVANNIIHRFALNGSFGLALNVTSAVRGPIHVLNNNFWNFSESAGLVRYRNPGPPDYTAAQLNTAFPDFCSGNVQLDPGFADVARRDFRLTASSPQAVRAGGRNMTADMGAGFVDFNGNPWDPANPSMGAFQFTANELPLSQGKSVTYSAAPSGESAGTPVSYLTDGDSTPAHLVTVGNPNQLVSATIDLGQRSAVQRLKMWHNWSDGRTYRDVIVQLSTTDDFTSGVTTVFNNDTDNSAGFGAGQDAEYAETAGGKEIVLGSPVAGRYVRFYSAGNSSDGLNSYAELQAFGYISSNEPPVILTEPTSQTVTEGDTVSFAVTTTGTPPPSYQWRKNGVPVSGATGATYTILSPEATDAGSYDVIVSNALGTSTSMTATLTVNPAPPGVERHLSIGKPVTYSAIRSGESTGFPPSYLTDGDTTLAHLVAVGNANQLVSATINLGQVNTVTKLKMWHYYADGRKYHDVIVQLSTTADFSSGVTTVFNNDTDNSAGFGVGSDAEYAETAAGKEIILSAPIFAQYARFYIAGNTINGFNHYVELQVFGYKGINTAPSITTGPASQMVTVGDSVSMNVTATGNPSPSYQWRKGGTPIAGATEMTYAIPSVVTADAGEYDVIVSNVLGSSTSAPATLTVNKAVATVTLEGLEQVYDGTPRTVTATTSPAGAEYTVTYDGAASPPVDAGSYAVAVTVVDPDYTGSATGTLVVAPAMANVALSGLEHTYDGTPKAATVATTPANIGYAVTYNGAAAPPVNAGSYAVSVTLTDSNYTGGATGTLNIAPALVPIVFDGLLQAYDGTPRVVTATTTPAGVPLAITYDGSVTPPVNPGIYEVVATVTDPNYSGTASDSLVVTITALVRRAPALNGALDGSLQVVSPEKITLNGEASISGDLLVPGSPAIKLNGEPLYGGTLDGVGAAQPTNYTITLNGSAVLRHVIRRTDGLDLPVVPLPPLPTGTRDVSINSPAQNPGDFATLRNLTLNGNAGDVAAPSGTYGAFTANGGSRFVLGVANTIEPTVYNLQGLNINGGSGVVIVGPVVINVAGNVTVSGTINGSGEPVWLEIKSASGGLTLNGGATLNGYVTAPEGKVTLNDSSTLTGGVIAEEISINENGMLAEPAN